MLNANVANVQWFFDNYAAEQNILIDTDNKITYYLRKLNGYSKYIDVKLKTNSVIGEEFSKGKVMFPLKFTNFNRLIQGENTL